MPGQSFAIDRSVVTVGRDSINDITLDEPSVSRQHAQLAYQEGWFYVQDLGSANGIVLDGVRIDGPQRIVPGQEVVLSRDVAFVLEWVPSTQQTAAMEYASDATSPQDPYHTPTAQWQVPQQAPAAVQPQVIPQPAPQTPATTGSGMTWLFVGCGVVLVLIAIIGIAGALMFTGVIPNPLAAPSNTPTHTPAAITPLPVIQTLTPTSTATVQAAGQPTATPYPTYTSYPTYTPVPTQAATATETPLPTPTLVPPTHTPVPPTNTAVPPTNTPIPPTNTPVPPTHTPVPTSTPVPTHTPTTPPPKPLSINHAVEGVACISKSQYRINFGIYLEGGTGEYAVYRDIDEQKVYGPGPATSVPYELTWGSNASAVGTFYVKSGGQRAESKFYVPNPDCSGF
jgi:hypothetical protein